MAAKNATIVLPDIESKYNDILKEQKNKYAPAKNTANPIVGKLSILFVFNNAQFKKLCYSEE